MIRPVEFFWTGEMMRPAERFKAMARQQYHKGETYTLVVEEERSSASHRHYFACLNEAWQNLPDNIRFSADPVTGEVTDNYPTMDHLRKRALIKCGYFDEKVFVCKNEEQLNFAMTFIHMIEEMDEFKVILVRGLVIKIFSPKSQSVSVMKKDQFEKSKADVLALLADWIGVKPKELNNQGKQSSGG